jgi:hypothetical protein
VTGVFQLIVEIGGVQNAFVEASENRNAVEVTTDGIQRNVLEIVATPGPVWQPATQRIHQPLPKYLGDHIKPAATPFGDVS